MNYNNIKVLISTLVVTTTLLLTVAVFTTTTHAAQICSGASAQEALEGIASSGNVVKENSKYYGQVLLEEAYMTSSYGCSPEGTTVSVTYQAKVVNIQTSPGVFEDFFLGSQKTVQASFTWTDEDNHDLGGFYRTEALRIPDSDWTRSFENEVVEIHSISTEVSGHTVVHDSNRYYSELMSYDAATQRPAPIASKRTSARKMTGTGGIRPGYITCIVAKRDNCGSQNTEARRGLGMNVTTDTDNSAPTQEKPETVNDTETTSEQNTQKEEKSQLTVVEDTDEDTDTTEENNEESTYEDQSFDFQMKYPVGKKRGPITAADRYATTS